MKSIECREWYVYRQRYGRTDKELIGQINLLSELDWSMREDVIYEENSYVSSMISYILKDDVPTFELELDE